MNKPLHLQGENWNSDSAGPVGKPGRYGSCQKETGDGGKLAG